MPIYEYKCDCGKRYEKLQPSASKSIVCACGKKANRVYSTFRTIVDFRDGFDPGMGEYVSTKKQRGELLKAKGLSKEDEDHRDRWI